MSTHSRLVLKKTDGVPTATKKVSKKRSAASQNGPSPKKAHLQKSSKSPSSKRSHPVTLPEKNNVDSNSEEDGEEDEPDSEVEEVMDSEGADDVMRVDAPPKDPNGISFFLLQMVLPRMTSFLAIVKHLESLIRLSVRFTSNGVQQNHIPVFLPKQNASGPSHDKKICNRLNGRLMFANSWISFGERLRILFSSTTRVGSFRRL